ncbi:MAG: hypothetical protein K8T10_18715 [Candidatus Eremiobacteraeota bacterium]|nr:hypothetical protein [Candidatus Eremiobacteraeota bacterium]
MEKKNNNKKNKELGKNKVSEQNEGVKKEKRPFPILRILYIVMIVIFLLATFFYIRHFIEFYGNFHLADKQGEYPPLLPYYSTLISYPHSIVRDAGIAMLLACITFYLCLDFLFFYRLKGWKKALSIVLSLVFIFTCTECAMSHYLKVEELMHRPHPTLFWELSPGLLNMNLLQDKVFTNSHGFRSPEISMKKPPGQYRVMVLGDSSAFGFGVADDETFGAILSRDLRKKYPQKDVRFINGAVSGYTTHQAATFMKERGWKFSPNLIIISFNDDPQMEWKQDVQRAPGVILTPIFRLLYKSNIYLTFKQAILNARVRSNPKFAMSPDRGSETNRVTAKQLRKNLKDIQDEAKKRGADVITISMPLQAYGKTIEDYRGIMKESAQERGFLFLDLLKGWNDHPYEEVLIDVMHPNKKGHELIARDLLELIIENNIINK